MTERPEKRTRETREEDKRNPRRGQEKPEKGTRETHEKASGLTA